MSKLKVKKRTRYDKREVFKLFLKRIERNRSCSTNAIRDAIIKKANGEAKQHENEDIDSRSE